MPILKRYLESIANSIDKTGIAALTSDSVKDITSHAKYGDNVSPGGGATYA